MGRMIGVGAGPEHGGEGSASAVMGGFLKIGPVAARWPRRDGPLPIVENESADIDRAAAGMF